MVAPESANCCSEEQIDAHLPSSSLHLRPLLPRMEQERIMIKFDKIPHLLSSPAILYERTNPWYYSLLETEFDQIDEQSLSRMFMLESPKRTKSMLPA